MIRLGNGLAVTDTRFVGGGVAPAPARTITSVVVGALSAFALPVTITADAANGETVRWVLVPTAAAAPTAANVAAGQANGGGAPTASGNFVWPGPSTITLPGGIVRANYDLYVVIDNGSLSNVGTPASDFEVDTVATVLSAVSFTDNGAAAVSRAFTPNEAGDFRWSLWPSGTNPSNSLIASGTGASFTGTGTGSAGVAVTGTVSTGEGTFQPTVWYRDAYGNQVWQTYSNVTVAAVSGPTATLIASQGGNSTSQTKTLDLSSVPSGARLLIGIACGGLTAGGQTVTAMTVQGDAATNRGRSAGVFLNAAEWWEVTLSSAGSASANIVCTRGGLTQWGVVVYQITGTVTTRTFEGNERANSTLTLSRTINTVAPGVLLCVSGQDDGPHVPTWTNATKDGEVLIVTNRPVTYARHSVTVTETPRTITLDPTPISGSAGSSMALIALS